MRSIWERVRKSYLMVVSLVAVLGTWNALAGYLDLPGPKVVSKSVREIFIDKPSLIAYDVSIDSSMGMAPVAATLPRPPVCDDRAAVELLDQATTAVTPPRSRAERHIFPLVDGTMNLRSPAPNSTAFQVQAVTTSPAITLSFLLENPQAAEAPVVLDGIVILTERLGDLTARDYRLRVTWTRSPVLVPQAIPVLRLHSFVSTDSNLSPTVIQTQIEPTSTSRWLQGNGESRSTSSWTAQGCIPWAPRCWGFNRAAQSNNHCPKVCSGGLVSVAAASRTQVQTLSSLIDAREPGS
jgi:hypothetical protein